MAQLYPHPTGLSEFAATILHDVKPDRRRVLQSNFRQNRSVKGDDNDDTLTTRNGCRQDVFSRKCYDNKHLRDENDTDGFDGTFLFWERGGLRSLGNIKEARING